MFGGRKFAETMDENAAAVQRQDYQTSAGSLSPKRIEAIHIAFNKVFNQGRIEGLIREPSTYRTFDEVYEIEIGRQNGQDVDESKYPVPIATQTRIVNDLTNFDADSQNGKCLAVSKTGPKVDILDSQESGEDGMLFSDEEQMEPQTEKLPLQGRKRPSSRKQTIVSPKHKRRRRVQYSDPLIVDNRKSTPSHTNPRSPASTPMRRKSFTPQRITRRLTETSALPSNPHSRTARLSKAHSVNLPPMTTITLVCQRDHPPKPVHLRIPFYGRRRTSSKYISLDRLWELHYRLERLKKAELPLTSIVSTGKPKSTLNVSSAQYVESGTKGLGRGRGRGNRGGRGRGSGGGYGELKGMLLPDGAMVRKIEKAKAKRGGMLGFRR